MEIVLDIIIFEESKKRHLLDLFILLALLETEKSLSFNLHFTVSSPMLEKNSSNNLSFNDRLLIEFLFSSKL